MSDMGGESVPAAANRELSADGELSLNVCARRDGCGGKRGDGPGSPTAHKLAGHRFRRAYRSGLRTRSGRSYRRLGWQRDFRHRPVRGDRRAADPRPGDPESAGRQDHAADNQPAQHNRNRQSGRRPAQQQGADPDQFAAHPFSPQIASSVTGFIHSTVLSVVSSPAAATAWVQVNTVAHQAVVKVLSGQGNGAISTSNGQIVLNLGPFIAVAKQDLVAKGFSLASNIPAVSPTLALFQANGPRKGAAAYRLVTTLKIVLPILALVLIAAGVYVARGRGGPWSEPGSAWPRPCLSWASACRSPVAIYLNSVPSATLPSDAAAAAFDALVHFLKQGLRGRAGGRAGRRHRGVLHRALSHRGPDPFGAEVGDGVDPELRRAQGHVHRSGRPVDLPAPQGPSYRSGGTRRPDIRLLGFTHGAWWSS